MSEKSPHSSTGAPSGLSRLQRPGGIALIAVGAVLLALVGGYYLYGVWSKASIDDYSAERSRPAPSQPASPVQPTPMVVAVVAPSPTPPPTAEPRRVEVQPTPTAAQASPTPTLVAASPTPTPAVDASGQRTGPSGFSQVMGRETPTPCTNAHADGRAGLRGHHRAGPPETDRLVDCRGHEVLAGLY